MTERIYELERDGFAWVRSAFSSADIARMAEQLAAVLRDEAENSAILAGSSGPAYGARNLLKLWPAGRTLVVSSPPLAAILRSVVGDAAGVVRGLYFDKPPGHSWALPWHRDYTVAVREHRPSAAFKKPTIKAGVPHLEADVDLLGRMLTVRIHLDAMTHDNGPLRVVPGSHRTTDDLTEDAVTLHCHPGDVLLMRPLLLHASGHSLPTTDEHRRIVHLECAPSRELPDGLEWDQFEPL
ncbi:phytanoyl-CoA dioxygenase family protein [Limnoglobus roseus]|uniref:Phytanoyl-CoA dioxygenase n=1 Tax=Limnoglobus roseus TaxID=2598579 RepID=A0A5C1AI48_9BACT|nr:phytanoyl-CoA dioxygenase family protein [Limnoglobus roseus]QEL17933.1 phytanoyl-CoA dioxygenase [Limnoglobus roseus]